MGNGLRPLDSKPVGMHRTARLLVVEDDPLLARGMATRLRFEGWSVDTVGDGTEAVDIATRGRHDILLLDVSLPGMDGLEVLDAVRRLPSPPAVILVSGYLDVARTMFALDRGAMEVLEKPIDPSRLSGIVEDVETRWLASSRHAKSLKPIVALDIPELVGDSARMQLLREQVVKASRFPDLPVMIIGDTGTGKELVAHAIHRLTARAGKLVAINCAAQPETLWESELFGHEPGAFTGATTSRVGLLEAAGTGTVFLDEVGEMPPTQQAKLLRAVETRTFRRVGSNTSFPFSARIVSATNRRLSGREDSGFRSDLFFRLAGFTIRTPALAHRMGDIDALARHLVLEFAKTSGTTPHHISPRAIEALHAYDWPGNVRELKSIVQVASVHATQSTVGVRDVVDAMRSRGCLGGEVSRTRRGSGVTFAETRSGYAPSRHESAPPFSTAPPHASLPPHASVPPHGSAPPHATESPHTRGPSYPPESRADNPPYRVRLQSGVSPIQRDAPASLPDIERAHIERAYEESGRNVSVAARLLGIPRTTLRDKLTRFGLR